MSRLHQDCVGRCEAISESLPKTAISDQQVGAGEPTKVPPSSGESISASRLRLAFIPLERVLTFGAACVDPDDVREVGDAVGSGTSPTAVTHAPHGHIRLVVDGRRIYVDNTSHDFRRQLNTTLGGARQD